MTIPLLHTTPTQKGFSLPSSLEPRQVGVLPISPMKIDWDHELAEHAMFCVLPGVSDVDLVTGRMPTSKAGAWSYANGGVKFPSSSYWEYGVYPNLRLDDSAMMVAVVDAGPGFLVALCYAQSNQGDRHVAISKSLDGNGTFTYRCDENSGFNAGGDPGVNDCTIVGMTGGVLEAGGALRTRLYHHYEEIGYQLIVSGGGWVGTQDRMTIGARRDSSPTYSAGGIVKMVAMFHRPLSYDSCKSLSVDPYQFLKPAV